MQVKRLLSPIVTVELREGQTVDTSVCMCCLFQLQSVWLCAQPDALFVIVPALALPTKLAAFAYIVTFVIGTVAAMGGYAALIGAWHPWLCRGASLLAW